MDRNDLKVLNFMENSQFIHIDLKDPEQCCLEKWYPEDVLIPERNFPCFFFNFSLKMYVFFIWTFGFQKNSQMVLYLLIYH